MILMKKLNCNELNFQHLQDTFDNYRKAGISNFRTLFKLLHSLKQIGRRISSIAMTLQKIFLATIFSLLFELKSVNLYLRPDYTILIKLLVFFKFLH